MVKNGHICNRLKGSSRCLKMIEDGNCPSGLFSINDETKNCCGRKISATMELTQPESIFGRQLRQEVFGDREVEIVFL